MKASWVKTGWLQDRDYGVRLSLSKKKGGIFVSQKAVWMNKSSLHRSLPCSGEGACAAQSQGIRSHHFRTIEGEEMKVVADFIFLDSQVNCRGWLQSWNEKMLAPLEESYDKPRQHTQKHIVKAMVFPVIMHDSKSWTTRKTEDRRTDALELCWRRLLRIVWTARR